MSKNRYSITGIASSLFSWKALLLLSGISILAFISTLWHRYAYIDDCWFGEQAFYLSSTGMVKTPSIQAGLGWEERLFIYHKLNIWIGAVLVNFLGWSVYYFKTFTLTVYLSFYFFLYRYYRLRTVSISREEIMLSALLLFANPLMFIYGYTYRPEILVMVLGFMSFLSLEKARISGNSKQIWAAMGGLAAGFAFLGHLNGMIFGVAGFVFLILYKKWSLLPVFSISGIAVASLYFIDLAEPGNLQALVEQFRNWPDPISGNYLSGKSVWLSVLEKLGNEHQRFFWSDRSAIFSGIFILSLFFSFRHLRKEHASLLIYCGLLVVFLNLLGSQIAERYLIYYLPMMAMIIAFSVNHLIRNRKALQISIIAIMFLIQLGVLGKHTTMILKANNDFVSLNHELAKHIPEAKGKVLAPYHFIYNEIGKQPLLTYHSLEYYEVKNKEQLTGQQALKHCRELGVSHIIVDTGLEKDGAKYRWFEKAILGQDSSYKVKEKFKGFVILESRDFH